MIFRTTDGKRYAIDFDERKAYTQGDEVIEFDLLLNVYVGSPNAKFYTGTSKERKKIHETLEVVEVIGSPLDQKQESDFTTFQTGSSLYELDARGKRMRRLAGFNETEMKVPDGEWRAFELSTELYEGIPFSVRWGANDNLHTSYVREIRVAGRKVKAA